MNISLHADYACRVLMFLATTKNKQSSIQMVADAFTISENHLVKVVHKLGKQGFISTTRGRGGGIALSRPATEILIGDVIRKMEPNFDIVECFNSETNSCPIGSVCRLKNALYKARDAFLACLDELTLAEIVTNKSVLSHTLKVSAPSG